MSRKPTTLIIDEATGRLIAALSTHVVGNLMTVLFNRGAIDADDIRAVIDLTRHGEPDDQPSQIMIAGLLADAIEMRLKQVLDEN